uniref:Bulb-type lectin domain-containing protein n=1 Tax=Corethron hystrix TaxID=216773 RepID=A0A7S1C167_9STRA|mmetsp:Transcript_7568/g.16400  ORF Transcript_7568/g.16400 Transcript_7568/m.16400 type:complete len:600 (+) Transcript_7568:601-2400(+)
MLKMSRATVLIASHFLYLLCHAESQILRFNCEGSSLTAGVKIRHMDGYCSPDERSGIYFYGRQCKLLICGPEDDGDMRCDREIGRSGGRNVSCTRMGFAQLDSRGDLVVYTRPGVRLWRLSDDNADTRATFGTGNLLFDRGISGSAVLQVSNTIIETRVDNNVQWRSGDNSLSGGSSCLGSSISASGQQPYFLYDTNSVCSPDEQHRIFFRTEGCQLVSCRVSTGNTQSSCVESVTTPTEPNCPNGFAVLQTNGNIIIYFRNGNSNLQEVYNLMDDGNFGTFDVAILPISGTATLTVTNNGVFEITVNNVRQWSLTGSSDGIICRSSSVTIPNGQPVVLYNNEGYCSPDKKYAIYFKVCQLQICETTATIMTPNNGLVCNRIIDSTPRSCAQGFATLLSSGDMVISEMVGSSNREIYRLSTNDLFGESPLTPNMGRGPATLIVMNDGVIFTRDNNGNTLWTGNSNSNVNNPGNCIDNDSLMRQSTFSGLSCLQYLRSFNPNKYPCNNRVLLNGNGQKVQVKEICVRSCYFSCNPADPRNSCYDTPDDQAQRELGFFLSCKIVSNNLDRCFEMTVGGGGQVRDYCRNTCKVDSSCIGREL